MDTTVLAPSPVPPPALVLNPPRSRRDLEQLLRSRLMVLTGLAAIAAAFFMAFRASIPAQWAFFRATRIGNGLLIYESAFFVVAVTAFVTLWRRRHWSLRSLRVIEYTVVGLFAVYITWSQLFAWVGYRFLASGATSLDPTVVRQAVDSMAGRWLALIVGLATLIPETWRRSASQSIGLAATAIGITAWMAFRDPLYLAHASRMVVLMTFWMLIATTIAIFGSYKLAELREQVREARQLGQYKLVRRIGAGGMGEVHLAEHVMLKQPCAIKLIRPERAGDPAILRRFEREVQATARLTHWNTVQIFDYGYADDGTFYYAMEYLPGLTLEQIVERHGPLPAARAVHFLRQVCAALREAHAMGLVHRDIKPANIIACERGGVRDVAKLVDFGLVRHTGFAQADDSLTSGNTVMGTPSYMAPEQATAPDRLDARTDIYCLGAVAYFLLTGRPPFIRDTAMQVLAAHQRETPQSPSEIRSTVPTDVEAVVLRCLAKLPEDRFATVADLDQALVDCADTGRWRETDAAAWWGRISAV